MFCENGSAAVELFIDEFIGVRQKLSPLLPASYLASAAKHSSLLVSKNRAQIIWRGIRRPAFSFGFHGIPRDSRNERSLLRISGLKNTSRWANSLSVSSAIIFSLKLFPVSLVSAS